MPPMVSAVRGPNTAPTEPTIATLLAHMLGTETNRKKGQEEVRRWCLVRTTKCDCWVKLRNVELAHESAPAGAHVSASEVKEAVAAACAARLPSTVHGHARIKPVRGAPQRRWN